MSDKTITKPQIKKLQLVELNPIDLGSVTGGRDVRHVGQTHTQSATKATTNSTNK